MKIGIIGSGMVGQAFATKLASQGHAVMIGTRDPKKLAEWLSQADQSIKVGSFSETAAHGEIVFNATRGVISLEALQLAGAENLRGRILIDVANAFDPTQGHAAQATIPNNDSLGEQIQRAFPETKVVKTLNTLADLLMVEPGLLADGDHQLFMSGNDLEAKKQVAELLKTTFGWKHIIDLGDITTSRAVEPLALLWMLLWRRLGTRTFNFKIVASDNQDQPWPFPNNEAYVWDDQT